MNVMCSFLLFLSSLRLPIYHPGIAHTCELVDPRMKVIFSPKKGSEIMVLNNPLYVLKWGRKWRGIWWWWWWRTHLSGTSFYYSKSGFLHLPPVLTKITYSDSRTTTSQTGFSNKKIQVNLHFCYKLKICNIVRGKFQKDCLAYKKHVCI